MGDVKIGPMSRRSITRDLGGNVVTMLDEENGGYIIRNRQIVNPARYEELKRIERDKKEAAMAASKAIARPDAPDRTVNPTQAKAESAKIAELEAKVNGMDSKMDAILAALSKPKRVTKKKNDKPTEATEA